MNESEAARRWLSRWINALRRGPRDEPNRDALIHACKRGGLEPPDDNEPLSAWSERVTAPYRDERWT